MITGAERLTAKGDTFGMDMKLFGVPYTSATWSWSSSRTGTHRAAALRRAPLALRARAGRRRRHPVTETWDATRYSAPLFAALRALGFPARNQVDHRTLVRLKKAAEEDLATR